MTIGSLVLTFTLGAMIDINGSRYMRSNKEPPPPQKKGLVIKFPYLASIAHIVVLNGPP